MRGSKCRADCLNCPDVSCSLEVKSDLTGRAYSSVNIKSFESHCKVRKCVYLLTCKNRSI